MEFGVHLPLMAWGGETFTLQALLRFARAARDLGFRAISANDHLVFHRPWLDGPTALAAILPEVEGLEIATTVTLPVVRGPALLAKALAAIDVLSGGRLVVAVGPGSYRGDYQVQGIPWEERWPRFDEAIRALRALLRPDDAPFEGRFYSTEGVRLEPAPLRRDGPPIWIGSWGSDASLRRVARLGDGWLASAYNTTPEAFTEARGRLEAALRRSGRDPGPFPSAVATMFFHVTEDRTRAERVLTELIAPGLGRPPEEAGQRLLVGSAEACAEKLVKYKEAGVQRMYLWPVGDEVGQLEMFHETVLPLVHT